MGILTDSRGVPADYRGVKVHYRGVPADYRGVKVHYRGVPAENSEVTIKTVSCQVQKEVEKVETDSV